MSLADVCGITVGRTPARANPEFWGNDHPWVSIADMNQGHWIEHTKEKISKSGTGGRPPVAAGTVLLSFKLSIGKVSRARFPLYTNEAIAALPIKPGVDLSESYLARYLQALPLAEGANRAAMGATLNKKILASLEVSFPERGEQDRVTSILDEADAIRTKRRAQLRRLDDLPDTLFHQKFVNTSNAHPTIQLGDIARWSSGKFLPASKQAGGPVPVYGGNGINGAHDRPTYKLRRLIVGRVGANCGAVHLTRPNSWITDNALVAEILRTDVDISYLEYALRSANLNQYSAQSGQPSISGARISEVPIRLPPLEAQESFADAITAIRAERDHVAKALEADEELFAALQHRAFRGEL